MGVPLTMADESVMAVRNKMHGRRLRKLCDSISGGWHDLPPNLIEQESFLHAWFSISRAALRQRHDEKIERFAWLLLNGARYGLLYEDAFDEYINILEDLSLRELHLLILRQESEQNFMVSGTRSNPDDDPDTAFRRDGMTEFVERAERQLGIPPDQLGPILVRIQRTGLYRLANVYGDNDGRSGMLTPLFDEFVQWIGQKDPARKSSMH